MSSNSEAILGAANSARGLVNTSTLLVAFGLSIMVINNYRQCRAPGNKKAGSGYKKDMYVEYSYYLAVIILIAAVLMIALDLGKAFKIIK
jgi:hypothetical protein